MIDLTKQYDFFNPTKDTSTIHIIGCGSVGSSLAELLPRIGISHKVVLYDFDKVEAHNISNQMFKDSDIGKLKVEAVKDLMMEIDPTIPDDKIVLKPNGWQGEMLSGYVFLACDSIDVRRDFVEKHMYNPNIKAVFDIRTMLTGAQHYAADWMDVTSKNNLLKSMQFTHEEAAEETPVSACGVTLGIVTTVRLITSLAINNYIKFVKGEGIWKFVQIDGFSGILDAF